MKPSRARSVEETSRTFAARGGWWVVGQSLLLVALLVSPLLARQQWRSTISFTAGTVLFAIGAFMGVAGARALGRNRTAFPEPMEGGTLVRRGVYRVVRHPLYSSLMFLSFGWGLLWQSGAAAVIALLLTLLLTAKARREEVRLQEKFPEYNDYAKSVRKFIPRLW